MLLWVVSALLVLFGTFDVWYFLRGAWAVLGSMLLEPIRDVLAEQVIDGQVLPHDIDYMGHMNNARYLRECDFARLSYYARTGLFQAAHKLSARMVIGASTIRYRRSLGLGESFHLRSRIVYWDEKSFFFEQRFVSKKDGFVSAVVLCRQNIIRGSPDQLIEQACKGKISTLQINIEDVRTLKELVWNYVVNKETVQSCHQSSFKESKVECPNIPEDLQHWINYISASSQALRVESGLNDKTK